MRILQTTQILHMEETQMGIEMSKDVYSYIYSKKISWIFIA